MKKDELKNQKEFINKTTNKKECCLSQNQPNTKECEYISKSAKIDSSATIYPNVFIVGDCVIGKNTVIGAGSVVTKDIPSNVVAVGNPCRVLREVNDRDKEYYFKDRKINIK